MEAENSNPITGISDSEQSVQMSEQNTSEIVFFEEEAVRLKRAFLNVEQGENQLLYLRHQLKYMKSFFTKLELPWDQYIPLLFRSIPYYMIQEESRNVRNKNYRLSTELIDCITYLSQSGRLINNMASYFDEQIKEIDEIISARNIVP